MFALRNQVRTHIARGFVSARQSLSTLALIEQSNGTIAGSTLNALTAAKELGGDVTALVAGSKAADVAAQVAKIKGIAAVLTASSPAYDHGLPENYADLVAAATKEGGFTHVVAPSSAFGKNVLPESPLCSTPPRSPTSPRLSPRTPLCDPSTLATPLRPSSPRTPSSC